MSAPSKDDKLSGGGGGFGSASQKKKRGSVGAESDPSRVVGEGGVLCVGKKKTEGPDLAGKKYG